MLNLTPEEAADEGKYKDTPQNADQNIGQSPCPLSIGEQFLGVCTERAKCAEPSTKTDGHGGVKGVLIGPFGSESGCGPGQDGSRGQVRGQCAKGKGCFTIEPNTKCMAHDRAKSATKKDGQKKGGSQGVHAVIFSLKTLENS